MLVQLTKFKGKSSVNMYFEGNEGAHLMALIEADEHIKSGGWCLLQADNIAQMIEKPVFARGNHGQK